jgi:glycosyltransferase involved in cell wall biosynthesis
MGLLIDVVANDGSPIGPILADVYGKNGRVGIGGSELAILTLLEQWAKEGNKVRFYNDPVGDTRDQPFEQLPRSAFVKNEPGRDILINFRSPNPMIRGATGLKVWFSCDQNTLGGYAEAAPLMDKIVVISKFHKDYFESAYNIRNATVIDLPVRNDYDLPNPPKKIYTQALYASIPDRGLWFMDKVWPRVKERVPEAEFIITSDYRLWGVATSNEAYRLQFLRMPGVRFLGAVPRDELVQYQLSSGVLPYPCTYIELFCITVAEALVAGCAPITTGIGALSTTNTYKVLPYEPTNRGWLVRFAEEIVMEMIQPNLELRAATQKAARERFSLERISKIWKDEIFT